jgi:hypothetical protein
MIQLPILSQKTKQMKILMVSIPPLIPYCTLNLIIAEEYYKNDYPDEEDPSDEDSNGTLFSAVCNSNSDHCVVDEFHEDSENESTRYEEDGSDHEWR